MSGFVRSLYNAVTDRDEQFETFQRSIRANQQPEKIKTFVANINRDNPNTLTDETPDIINAKILEKSYAIAMADPRIKNLKPGESLYIKKPTGPEFKADEDRTICVLRETDGSFHLFIELKQRYADGNKSEDHIPSGTDKKRKIAWDVSGEKPEPYASLILKIRDTVKEKINDKITRINKELDKNSLFNNLKGFAKNLTGPLRENKDGSKTLTIYSPFRPLELSDFLAVKKDKADEQMSAELKEQKTVFGVKLPKYKVDMIQQLLDMLSVKDNKQIEHKDIKPENILMNLIRDEKGLTKAVNLELTDWGFALGYGAKESLKGSINSMSPWAIVRSGKADFESVINLFNSQKYYVPEDFIKIGDSYSKVHADSLSAKDFLISNSISEAKGLISETMNGSHDTYAMGAIIYQLMYDEELKNYHVNEDDSASNTSTSTTQSKATDDGLFSGMLSSVKSVFSNLFTEDNEKAQGLDAKINIQKDPSQEQDERIKSNPLLRVMLSPAPAKPEILQGIFSNLTAEKSPELEKKGPPKTYMNDAINKSNARVGYLIKEETPVVAYAGNNPDDNFGKKSTKPP